MIQKTIDDLTAILNADWFVVTNKGERRIIPVKIVSVSPDLTCMVERRNNPDALPDGKLTISDLHETRLAAFTAFESAQTVQRDIALEDRNA